MLTLQIECGHEVPDIPSTQARILLYPSFCKLNKPPLIVDRFDALPLTLSRIIHESSTAEKVGGNSDVSLLLLLARDAKNFADSDKGIEHRYSAQMNEYSSEPGILVGRFKVNFRQHACVKIQRVRLTDDFIVSHEISPDTNVGLTLGISSGAKLRAPDAVVKQGS